MADNVPITPGAGADIATDDCGAGGHTQIIKLAISTNGSVTLIPADATDGLLVNLGANNDVTVTGSVTANAGTNLNTSALALEGGGNLAAAAASLAVIDDWDESDRAKVNLIVGQAGVQGGSGAVSATTQRVVLATDVALPAGTNAIGKLAANSGVDIGDVDVTSVTPGTGATNLGKAEDAGHTTGDVGVMALGVRNDANASLAGTDLDYVPASMDAAGNANVITRRGKVRASVQSGGLTTASTAYTAGDQVGTQFTIAGAARASGGSGAIVGVTLIDAADIIGAYEVWFFDSSATPASDNAAFSISDADALKLIGPPVQLTGAWDAGGCRVAGLANLYLPYTCSGGTSLYAMLVCRVGHTFFGAVTNLQLIVQMELD